MKKHQRTTLAELITDSVKNLKFPLPKHDQTQTVASGKWLHLRQLSYTVPQESALGSGNQRSWEMVQRSSNLYSEQQHLNNKTASDDKVTRVDAVEIIALLKAPNDDHNEEVEEYIVLVVQYRPPLKNYCIEFPAGLVDRPESLQNFADTRDELESELELIRETARRELKEETGLKTKRILSVSEPMYNDPGLTNTNCRLVKLELDTSDYPRDDSNQLVVESEREEDEWSLQTILVPVRELKHVLDQLVREHGCCVDAKLYSYALASEI